MKNWDAVRDSEEYEAFRNEIKAKRERREKITPQEAGRLGGLSTRELYEFQHYQRAGRKGAAARRGKDRSA